MTDDPHDFCPVGVGALSLMALYVEGLARRAEMRAVQDCFEAVPGRTDVVRFKRPRQFNITRLTPKGG